MNTIQILEYYSRADIQQALLSAAKGREISGMYRTGGFSKRPNTLVYPQDIVSQVRSGIVEFHSSIELWENPITLSKRTGFDMILDLDCKMFEHGKIAAKVLIDTLKKHGIQNISIKFTGNRGFHIGIPWNSLPMEVDFKPTASLFPEVARKISMYLKMFMEESLEKALLKKYSPEQLADVAGIPVGTLLTKDGIHSFKVVDIDSVLLSPRHLFRMPYSLNKKTFLVSTPMNTEDLDDFVPEKASPERVKTEMRFLSLSKKGEAELLFAEGLDWASKNKVKERPTKKRLITSKIPEDLFPPCVKNIRAGVKDGKKRSVFILIKFLHSLKWEWDEISTFLKEWNTKNQPPLPEQYLVTQIRYYRDKKKFPPPNCTQEGWYTSFGVCNPDKTCKSREDVKNPVNYPFRLLKKPRNKPKKRTRKRS